jgi:hypothetical protein
MEKGNLEMLSLIANQDARGGIITQAGPHEIHFPTIEDLTQALMKASIDPSKYKHQLDHLRSGIPVSLLVTSFELSAFYS